NPQGIAYDGLNDRLWINEHGPRGGDEINLVIKGRNYGWPAVSHGKEYWNPLPVGEATSKPGMEDPKKVYIPSIAPSSLLLYTGEAFPHWQGSLFSGTLKLTHLNRVTVDKTGNIIAEERLLEQLNERIRQVIQSPEGWLYVSTDSGKILRIKPE
ncbi:MAG: PQQ-dependent sugar dehydrogenase, partial [Porticoccaceae bacterium]|nr:PQQ-dependent sugar dehydrogenase [Porticoccaceae bacterium]